MSLTTQSFEQFQTLLETQYAAVAALPANTDAGSALGAIFNAAALIALVTQNEVIYVDKIARLASIPALPNGAPNPDVDTFVNPFGITRLGASVSSGQVVCSTPSLVGVQVVVPVGAILTTQSGLQFGVIADASNGAYSAALGGYPINPGYQSVSVTVQCLSPGIVGNVLAGQISVIYGSSTTPMPASIQSVTNPAAFTNGVDIESDAALKARFTVAASSGNVATANAIIATALAVQTGLMVSFGDQVNADLSAHAAYFTLVVNNQNTGSGPGSGLLSIVNNAVLNVHSAGISFQVIGPTLTTVNITGKVIPMAGYSAAALIPLVEAAAIAYVNGIGLAADTSSTTCSIARCYMSIIPQITGLFDIQNLQFNSGSIDLTTPFAHQFVAGTSVFIS